MFFTNLSRIFSLGLKNFWRNIWLSIATTLVMVLTLLSISSLSILNILVKYSISKIEEKIDIVLYIQENNIEGKIDDLRNALKNEKTIKEIIYVSEEEALKKFQEKFGKDTEIQETLQEMNENPLKPSLIIKANEIDDYPIILEAIEKADQEKIVEKINYEDNNKIIEKVSKISENIKKAGWILSGMFALISVLVMFNTIRLTIYSRRKEIAIMKLVGATNWYIRFPLIIEGVMYGIIAAMISTLILFPLFKIISPKVELYFQGLDFNMLDFFISHLFSIIGWQVLVGAFLGVFSSFIAMRKYLKI